MSSESILTLAVVVVAAGASFFFALAETALFSLGKWRVRQLAVQDPRQGGLVERLLERSAD